MRALSQLTGQAYSLETVTVRLLHTGQSENDLQSEVARIKSQIESEYAASKQGLEGLAQGTSRHRFITTKQENITGHFDALVNLVGVQKAAQIFDEAGQ